MNEPTRNLLVYADGRVEEVPFRLEGLYYAQTEKSPDGHVTQRIFRGDVAYEIDAADGGNCAMVYVERPSERSEYMPPDKATVNGTPIPVDVKPRERGWDARDVHRQCKANGGHKKSHSSDRCTLCELPGHLLRRMEFLDASEESKRTEAAGLRDQLVALRDENRTLLVENATLRRRLERAATRSGGTEP